LTLKMEVTFSWMSGDFQQTTWHYTPEDRAFCNDCCENLKSYIGQVFWLGKYNSTFFPTKTIRSFQILYWRVAWH
jgi:hypothetical protein